MTWDFYLNTIISGLLTGCVYALLAIGLSIIFGVVHIVNFAHGEMLAVGMYLALVLFTLGGIDPLWSIPIAMAVMFALGYGLYHSLLRRFVSRPDYQQFLVMIALSTVLTSVLLMAAGPDARTAFVPYGFDSFAVGPVILDKTRSYAAAVAVAMVVALYLFFGLTRTGTAIRACADNPRGALVVGLNVQRLYAITVGLGIASAGVAGCLLLLVGDVHPYVGSEFTLLSFIIVIVGGLGSMTGALLGGILIGLAEALAAALVEPSLKSLFSFLLLIVVLVLRPNGLLGRAEAT